MASTSPTPQASRPRIRDVVASEVRALCGRYSIRQAELAGILGITQSQVSKRLRGDLPFTLDEVELLADAFDVEVDVLLGRAPAGTPNGPPPGVRATGRRRLPRLDSNQQPADHSHGMTRIGQEYYPRAA